MARVFSPVEVSRRYSRRARKYRWEAEDRGHDAGRVATPSGAGRRLVLVSACADGYQENDRTWRS